MPTNMDKYKQVKVYNLETFNNGCK